MKQPMAMKQPAALSAQGAVRGAVRGAVLAGALASSMAMTGTMTGAMAAERTVTLAVENMTCASCSYIVKKSMEGVPGVSRVAVSYEKKTATVTFDDTQTSVDAIAGASSGNGYPARRVEQGD